MPDVIDTTARAADDDDGGFDAVYPPDPQPGTAIEPAAPPPLTGELDVVPPHRELQGMAAMAATFAGSALVPKALQDRPADVMLVLMTARDLGLSATVALRECHPIDGKVTVSPKLKLAIVRQRGLGRVWPDPGNDATGARWYAIRADDPETTYSSTYSIDDARMAGLDRKDNWRKYPARMLSWRALGYLLDDAFSEVGTGLYSPDEMGAMTDEDGAPIDVREVEPLVPSSRARQQASRAAADAPADGADLWHLQSRLLALPAEQQLQWREQKSKQDRLRGTPSADLSESQLRLARSMISGLESAARRSDPDYDPEHAAEQVRTAAFARIVDAVIWAPADGGGDVPEPPEEPVSEPAAVEPQDDPQVSVPPEPAAEPDTANERPTVADITEVRKNIEQTVARMKVGDVKADLAEYGLPTTGGASALRKLLVGHLVAIETTTTGETP